MSSLKSEKKKTYNKGVFVYCCNPASSCNFDSAHRCTAGGAAASEHPVLLLLQLSFEGKPS